MFGRAPADPLTLPSLRIRLLRGSAWATIGRVAAAALGFAMTALLTRLLSPRDMGVYLLALSLATVAGIAARLGLEKTVVRLIAEALGLGDGRKAREAIRTTWKLAGIATISLASVAWLLGVRVAGERLFDSPSLSELSGLVAAWLALLTFQMLLASTFRGFHNIRDATVFGGLLTASLTAGTFLLLLITRGTIGVRLAVQVTVACGVLSLAMGWGVLWRHVRRIPIASSGKPLGANVVLRMAWPVLVSNLALHVMHHADLWIIAASASEESVAIYGAASRAVMLVNLSLLVVNQVLPPIISELNVQGDRVRMERVLRLVATATSIPAIGVLAAFIFGGRAILGVLFGEFYADGALVLMILSAGQLSNVWVGSCGSALIMTGNERSMMRISTLTGVVSVAGALFAVGRWGVVGVAAATSAAMVLQQVLMLYSARLRCGVWTQVSPILFVREVARMVRSYPWRT